MSDLFGNHIVGFPTRWLKCCRLPAYIMLYLKIFYDVIRKLIYLLGTSHDSLIVLTDPVGMISSPDRNADGIYDNNVDIMWMIKAETTKVIRYQLMYVDIEPSDVCTRDALLVCNK